MNHATSQLGTTTGSFTQFLSSTQRGARIARLLTVAELRSWNASQDLTERAELVAAELSTNAVLHGRLPGRSFRLTLAFESRPVSSASTSPTRDSRPQVRPVSAVSDDSLPTGGPGLALVAAVADHCETLPFPLSDKTARAALSAL